MLNRQGNKEQLVFKAYKLRAGDYKHRKTAIQQVVLAQLDNDNDFSFITADSNNRKRF